MATRRPPSSRSISNPRAAAAPPPRPRSIMSKSGPSTRTNDEQAESNAATIQKTVRRNDEVDANIKVVIRCRKRSEREIQDNSPVIVTSSGAKGNQVSIETAAPQSTLGIVTLPPVRTYPFDLVFGPEADQAMLYHEVVNPMLEQVVGGYNCTLFAYGQTGTGKTYTMHGDLVPTPMGNPSPHAGMIPRVLFRLFHYLEKNKMDFSVKVSYIELYNEELRDLLAPDLSAPNGSTQPMGFGKDSGKGADGGLRIYEDANKRGVFVQGVQEASVTSCAQALEHLTKGSHRRQIAATKFNDHSSRSHSIFTLTVHTRESGVAGEDLLRVGKFNLVDLAGSENIGRSGAENMRAREAGMINQSLLTLGRVINALVDRSSHVPYRESKLTRLLQDSLGGHTKTCIIATVSPARSNVEETLSTLDYAMHAKSIKNKPEVNQRMTRNSLIKEYVAEIELLKADLQASREKSGIYFSEDSWIQHTKEDELRQTELVEAKKQVEIVEKQHRDVQEELDQSIGMLKQREAELKGTKEKLVVAERDLVEKDIELKGLKVALEEEIVVRQAHETTESALDAVANGLKVVAHDSIQDNAGLMEKLDRKEAILHTNLQAVQIHGTTIASATKILSQKLDEYAESHASRVAMLRRINQEFEAKHAEALEACGGRVQQQLQDVEGALQSMRSHDSVETQALESLRKVVEGTQHTFQTGFKQWAEKMTSTNEQTYTQLDRTLVSAFAEFDKTTKGLHLLLESVIIGASKFADSERHAISAAQKLVDDATQAENSRLRQQNENLLQALETQRAEGTKAKDSLIQRISGLLGEFMETRDHNLRKLIAPVAADNESAIGCMDGLSEQHRAVTSQMKNEGVAFNRGLDKGRAQSKTTVEEFNKVTLSTRETVNSNLTGAERRLSKEVTSYCQEVQGQTQAMTSSCAEAFTTYSRAKRLRLDGMNAMGGSLRSEFTSLNRGLKSMSEDVQGHAEQVTSSAQELEKMSDSYRSIASTNVHSLKQGCSSLQQEATQQDVSTGSTPRKRKWRYKDSWDLTNSRDDLLKEWRSRGASTIGSATFLAEHMPLPDEDAIMDQVDEEEVPPTQSTNDATPEPSPRENAFPSSLQNSTSSTSSTNLPVQLPTVKGKSKLSSTSRYAPLADARNVYTTRASRRAR
ncbi:Kinesin- motor protein [Marasmius tenuissimus]|nr:Kinesin- motor protein [Marasmius tenuissimus]